MNPLKKCLEALVKEREKEILLKGEAKWRPLFHLSPPAGWLNDPNGLCYFQGRYHAYFQYSPLETEGGLKFWGHSTGTDMLNWRYEGCVLYPDSPYDCHGAYSGSAIAEDGNLYLYYTGNRKLEGDYDYINEGRESNVVLAVSKDGAQIGAKQLLLSNQDYPADLSCHVRDPKVFQENGSYYMLLGARTKAGKGLALLYESPDKYNWSLIQRLEKTGDYGYMWECPDLFRLEDKWFLLACPQGMERQGIRYQNIYQTGYFLLEGALETGGGKRPYSEFRLSDMTELDYGFDFYAPQTFLAQEGRRILIGWMGMPDAPEHKNPTAEYGWNQILTLPRELYTNNGKLCQRPIKELETYWTKQEEFDSCLSLPMMSCYQIDIWTEREDLKIMIADLELSYQQKTGIFYMRFSGVSGRGRTERCCAVEKLYQMTVIVDTSSAEVFLNEGESVLSTRFYPEHQTHHLSVRCENSRIRIQKV